MFLFYRVCSQASFWFFFSEIPIYTRLFVNLWSGERWRKAAWVRTDWPRKCFQIVFEWTQGITEEHIVRERWKRSNMDFLDSRGNETLIHRKWCVFQFDNMVIGVAANTSHDHFHPSVSTQTSIGDA